MPETFPPKLSQLLQQELGAGHFASQEEVLLAALELLGQYRSHQHQLLREQIKASVEQAEQEETIELEDDDALRDFLTTSNDVVVSVTSNPKPHESIFPYTSCGR